MLIPRAAKGLDNLSQVYDRQFFEQHKDLIPVFRELAHLIDDCSGHCTSNSIIDVGCGHGLLVESLRQSGYGEAYGLEGSANAKAVWPEKYWSNYNIADITDKNTLAAMRKTDLVCSFETGEHFQARFAEQYVRLLAVHKPRIIYFGAATVLQDCGVNPTHVNERPFSYWIDLFEHEDYLLDVLLTVKIKNAMFDKPVVFSKAWWYPKNILVFRPRIMVQDIEDELIAGLANMEIKWFNGTPKNQQLAACFLRDGFEYRYLIMDAVSRALHRLHVSR